MKSKQLLIPLCGIKQQKCWFIPHFLYKMFAGSNFMFTFATAISNKEEVSKQYIVLGNI